jgi:putative pyruvate formate lyase activating enzyme
MKLLDGIIDVYLTDYKWGNDACAQRLCNVINYTKITRRNHLLADQQAEILIRHLVLPGHTDCCSLPILHWLHDHLPDASINIMAQYRPAYHADDYPELRSFVTNQEYTEVINTAKELKLNII